MGIGAGFSTEAGVRSRPRSYSVRKEGIRVPCLFKCSGLIGGLDENTATGGFIRFSRLGGDFLDKNMAGTGWMFYLQKIGGVGGELKKHGKVKVPSYGGLDAILLGGGA